MEFIPVTHWWSGWQSYVASATTQISITNEDDDNNRLSHDNGCA